ncbi:MAG: putative sulfate exporter family transporter, partial [Moorella sp. (in: firmicutes)]
VALIWATRMGGSDAAGEANAKVIWDRFPKFVLGFVAASLLFSFILVPAMGVKTVDGIIKITSGLRGWLFAIAFVCIGLEANFRDLLKQVQGGKSVIQYIVGQLFNVVLTLFLAWLAFGGILFPKAM